MMSFPGTGPSAAAPIPSGPEIEKLVNSIPREAPPNHGPRADDPNFTEIGEAAEELAYAVVCLPEFKRFMVAVSGQGLSILQHGAQLAKVLFKKLCNFVTNKYVLAVILLVVVVLIAYYLLPQSVIAAAAWFVKDCVCALVDLVWPQCVRLASWYRYLFLQFMGQIQFRNLAFLIACLSTPTHMSHDRQVEY